MAASGEKGLGCRPMKEVREGFFLPANEKEIEVGEGERERG